MHKPENFKQPCRKRILEYFLQNTQKLKLDVNIEKICDMVS